MFESEAKPTGEFQETPHDAVEREAEAQPEEIVYGCREARDEVEKCGLGPALSLRE